MSFVLKTHINDESVYFRGWIADNRTRPEFGAKIKDAKHWKQKAICKRFINRNAGILNTFGITEPFRVIAPRYCLNCSKLMNPEMKKQAKFCCDKCRVGYFKNIY